MIERVELEEKTRRIRTEDMMTMLPYMMQRGGGMRGGADFYSNNNGYNF